jgi:endonuclease/exonuclease/phosphatase family metal-dependent hydrolase
MVDLAGARVHVYATHFDYRPDPAVRRTQVEETARIMAADGDVRQVLLGDLNAGPDAPELAPLWERLTDAWSVTYGPGGETFLADKPVKRIDYVAVSRGLAVTGCDVPVTLASDHRPVVADLAVTPTSW